MTGSFNDPYLVNNSSDRVIVDSKEAAAGLQLVLYGASKCISQMELCSSIS